MSGMILGLFLLEVSRNLLRLDCFLLYNDWIVADYNSPRNKSWEVSPDEPELDISPLPAHPPRLLNLLLDDVQVSGDVIFVGRERVRAPETVARGAEVAALHHDDTQVVQPLRSPDIVLLHRI